MIDDKLVGWGVFFSHFNLVLCGNMDPEEVWSEKAEKSVQLEEKYNGPSDIRHPSILRLPSILRRAANDNTQVF